MSKLPDHIDVSATEHADVSLRLDPAVPWRDACEAINALLEATDFVVFLLERRDERTVTLELTADRTGVVGPLIDDVCALLRERPDLDARIKVPGWVRTLYGYEPNVWSERNA